MATRNPAEARGRIIDAPFPHAPPEELELVPGRGTYTLDVARAEIDQAALARAFLHTPAAQVAFDEYSRVDRPADPTFRVTPFPQVDLTAIYRLNYDVLDRQPDVSALGWYRALASAYATWLREGERELWAVTVSRGRQPRTFKSQAQLLHALERAWEHLGEGERALAEALG